MNAQSKTLGIFRILLSVIFCVLNATSYAVLVDIPIWTPLPKSENSKYLFVAFQGSEFARQQLGEWHPKGLFEIKGSEEICYSVSQLKREDLKMSIEITIWNTRLDSKFILSWQWTLPADVKIIKVLATSPGVIEVQYPETGEIRKISLAGLPSVAIAKEKFVISSAAPMWNWGINRW